MSARLLVAAVVVVTSAVAACGRATPIETGEARGSATALLSAAVEWRGTHPGVCPTVDQLIADHAIVLDPDLHHGKNHDGRVGVIPSKVDPWGTGFTITCAAADVHVISAGPDQKLGTADDVIVPAQTGS